MEKPFNWLVDNINISGIAIYEEKFTKEDLEQIQKIYDNNKINIDFENKTKIDNICYKYRTLLTAQWDKKDNPLGFIMFNPSFANPEKPDNTLLNAIRFANNQNYNKIIICNLFSIRISKAKIFKQYMNESDTNYFTNYKWDCDIERLPDNIVLGWGKLPKNFPNIDNIIKNLYTSLKEVGKNLYQIYEKDNFQRHLASSSINQINGIEKLSLKQIYDYSQIYKFES